MAAPSNPSRPSIREIAAAAPPELADNPLVKFLRRMTPEQESLSEHLLERDLRELAAETERARAEDSAA